MNTRASRPTETSAAVEIVRREMIEAGAQAGREYYERTGGNSPEEIYRAMRAVAVAGEPQAATQGEPVYQIQRALAGDPLGTWRDATEEAYNLHMPDYRRILYTQAGIAAAPTARDLLASVLDIHDDGLVAEEARCYVPEAWDQILAEARAYLAQPALQAGKPQDMPVCKRDAALNAEFAAREATGGTEP